MAPIPQENISMGECVDDLSTSVDGEAVVISGMSGVFPMSNHVKEFADNLYAKVNMVTGETRYKYNHGEVQNYCGTVPDLEKFDAQFFGVHYRLTMTMDPMAKKILEHTYQAVYDAGVNPVDIRGKKIGVFTGSCFSEAEKAFFYVAAQRNGHGIVGCCKAMFANRISYWLDAKGPSMSVDAMCSSSIMALEKAVEAIRRGDCEAAIVGGASLCLHPQSSILYGRTVPMCGDGKTKSFDKNADGLVRSEAVNVLFLQKAKHAKRIYAEVCYVKSEFTPISTEKSGQRYGSYRPVEVIRNFLHNCYEDTNIIPAQVAYIEAFGNGVAESENNELEAIDQIFCKDRDRPLLIGSVMSNMGYTEAASGVSSIIKVCLGYHTGQLAGNLHYEEPRDVKGLREGRMRVITDHTNIGSAYAAVDSFSISGNNMHVLLKGFTKQKDLRRYQSSLPYLVGVSGRQESGVLKILNDLKARHIDPEEIALLHSIHNNNVHGHLARGYAILSKNEANETIALAEDLDYYASVKRPLWFVYSGMGSQWTTMGAELLRIPIFAAAIEKCHKVLAPRGIDVVKILTNPDKTIYDNILHSFVGIAAIQIGLTDILNELGIKPDFIMGHSVGELGCAYADGCFTAEEMILAAYARGLVSVETPFIRGSMAAIGLGYKEISKICPPEIEVACHNSSESSTISGPAEAMKEFVAKLSAQGIFAKEVPCSNIAYHSKYIADAGPGLRKYLSEVIKNPKERSEKWVSTSVSQDRWNEEVAKYSSADYHTNNLLSPVLFEETARLIPQNAIVVEIAPHGLLQAILKRSLNENCSNVPLTHRGHKDPVTFLLNAVGKLYKLGYNPKIQALYPKVEFPVSVGTPFLSHQVEWIHSEHWPLAIYAAANRLYAAERHMVISVHDDEHKYLEGHVIEDKIIFPLSAVLVMVWETLAMVLQEHRSRLSVQFHNVQCHKHVLINQEKSLKLSITIQRGSGRFEVTHNNFSVVTGLINPIKQSLLAKCQVRRTNVDTNIFELNTEDIYKIMYKKGYAYMDDFRSIHKANLDLSKMQVAWNDNWVTLIDSMIQLNVLRRHCDGVSMPKLIRALTIDIKIHEQTVVRNENGDIDVIFNEETQLTKCGGVIMEDIAFLDNPIRERNTIVKRKEFIPHFSTECLDFTTVLHAYLQLVGENTNRDIIKALEIIRTNEEGVLGAEVNKIIKDINFNLQLAKIFSDVISNDKIDDHTLLLGNELLTDNKIIKILKKKSGSKIFILSIEKSVKISDNIISPYTIIASANTPLGVLVLASWYTREQDNNICVTVDEDLLFLKQVRNNLKPMDRLLIITKYPPTAGLRDLVKTWRMDAEKYKINLIMSDLYTISDEEFLRVTQSQLAYYVFKNNVAGIELNLPIKSYKTEQNFKLNIAEPGNLDSLRWLETTLPATKSVRVKVHYAGPNYVDAQRAAGFLPSKDNDNCPAYGMDFSGVLESGEKVMGVVKEGALSAFIEADPDMLWPVPAHWSLEDAATVPQPYAYAFYCLAIKCQVTPSYAILVHGGAGALGQAVISVALGIGCTVFTTVSDTRKKTLLKKLFPELKVEHIGNSRDDSFEAMVMTMTKGKGCDIVINTLSGELREVSTRCVKPVGIFIDASLKDIYKNKSIGMAYLAGEKAYLPVFFSTIFKLNKPSEKRMLQLMMSDGIARGYVRPLSRVTYKPDEVTRAFSLVAGSRHRGRSLIHLEDLSTLAVTPRLSCSSKGSYIVVCGKQDFGVDIADRLVKRGARHLIIHCNPVVLNGYLLKHMKLWKDFGVNVKITTESLHDNDKSITLINNTNNMAPVEGLFVVDEGDSNIIVDLFDHATRKKCPNLKYFVVVCPIVKVTELHTQIIMSERRKNGLPSTLLLLPIKKQFNDSQTCESIDGNHSPLSTNEALNVMETSLQQNNPVITAYAVKDAPQLNMIEEVSNILGINSAVIKKLPDNTSLVQMGMDLDKLERVNKLLSESFNMFYNKDVLAKLTLTTLKKIHEESLKKLDQKHMEGCGLSAFYTNVDTDELRATIDMVVMPTFIHTSTERDDEFNSNETYLTIIPGLEGHYGMFQTLCERLKLQAVVLQAPLDECHQTVEELAQRFVKIMQKNMDLNGKKFYILGYSFGVLVAMEMVALLEDQGYEGTVFCLDSAPGVFSQQLLSAFGDVSEEELQNSIVKHMYSLMTGECLDTLTSELKALTNWKDKVDAYMRHLYGKSSISAQYMRSIIDAAYARIGAAARYNANNLKKIRSKVVLLRAKNQPQALEHLKDLDLSKYCQQDIMVYELNADHAGAHQDLRCSNIVNRHLEPYLLQRFSEQNLCETYLINGAKFIDSE